MRKYWPIFKHSTIFKLAVTAAISYVMYLLAGFLLPLLLAVGLAFALYPLVNAIAKVRMGHGIIRLSRVVAIILALMAFVGFVFLVVSSILLPLFGQINELLLKLPELMATKNVGSIDQFFRNPANFPKLPSSFDMLVDDVLTWAMGLVAQIIKNLLTSSMDILKNLIGLIIVPFLAFYFLKDWRVLRGMVINLFNYDAQAKAAHVLDEIGRTLSAYIRGLGILSLIAGCCIAAGTAFLGVKYSLVLGLLAMIAETIPVVGPMLGAVPAIFIAYGQSGADAFHVALFYLLFYQLDGNVLMPRVMGQKIDVHPVLLIISLLIGAKLFGILGMLFAVPVAAVYRVLYRELWHAGERKLP